jgi:tyrosyl-tRNA synthetase
MEQGRLHPREVKVRLAMELVARFHGDEAAKKARDGFDAQFRRGEIPEDIPEFVLSGDMDRNTVFLPRVLKEASLVKSASEARRLIKQGAVSIDGQKVSGDEVAVGEDGAVIKVGKRRFVRLK